MYRKEFYIVAKKDTDTESKNYKKLLALRSDRAGVINEDTGQWTDNIFLAKHLHTVKDAIDYASKQLNTDLVSSKSKTNTNCIETDYKIVKVFLDIDGNSEIVSKLYTQ